MSDNYTETDTNAEGTTADTFHVFQNETWMEINPDTLQVGGRNETILLMKDDNLVMLEPEQLSHMLRTGKDMWYETIRTTKRRAKKKKRRRRIDVNQRFESLLEQLNAHMACMTKMLMSMPKWLKHSQRALIQEKHSTRRSPTPTHVVVTADIHNKPDRHLKSSSSDDRIEEKQVTPDRTPEERRRKQRALVRKYQESASSDVEYLTDSSGVSAVKQQEVERDTRVAKRKKDSLKKAAKRFKSQGKSTSIVVTSSSSEDSDRDATFVPPPDDDDDDSDAAQIIKSELKSILKSRRTADTKKSSPSKSPNVSLKKSSRSRDLERVLEEDSETAIAKENSEPANSSYVKNRVYTMVEDHIILGHVLKEENTTLVKGTLMWKQFARHFYNMAKNTRTWQSLKNRYLKYILPNIKLYGLSPEKERNLRATAYTGEIQKLRRAKENSIFKVEPVMSASGTLRQKESKQKLLQHSLNTEPVASTSKTLSKSSSSSALRTSKRITPASSTPIKQSIPHNSTPKQSPKRPNPTYSELTRRFQRKAKVFLASNSSGDGSEYGSGKEFQKAGSRKLYNLRD